MGNQTSQIAELIAPKHWGHVEGSQNPADCPSRGLLPSELLHHHLWWSGPDWLRLKPEEWPKQSPLPPNVASEEEGELCLHSVVSQLNLLVPMARYSTFSRLKRVTAWIIRFVNNCRARKKDTALITSPLTVGEMDKAESYWVKLSQRAHFSREIGALRAGCGISRASPLLSLNPFLDTVGLLQVGGREQNSKRLYGSQPSHHACKASNCEVFRTLGTCASATCWSLAPLYLPLSLIPHSSWSQSNSVNHPYLCDLPVQVGKTSASTHGPVASEESHT